MDIFDLWIQAQHDDAMQLARESDAVQVRAIDRQRYVITFSCRGVVRDADGRVREHGQFVVGIRFPEDYLRSVNPAEILTWIAPREVWHPNIAPPFVCLGKVAPGTSLVGLIHRVYELITFDNVTMRENDALNRAACAWARRNRALFPFDTRPIKRLRSADAEELRA